MSCLGAYLREVRINLGLSQDAVFDKTGITDSRLSRIESGENKEPSAIALKQLAEAYSIDPVDLLIRAG